MDKLSAYLDPQFALNDFVRSYSFKLPSSRLMKKLQWHRYQALELIPDQLPASRSAESSATQPRRSRSWLQAFWQVIDIALFRDLEPRVWQSIDSRTGKTRWHLYNPETGETRHLNSEAEIRQWLEQLLHR